MTGPDPGAYERGTGAPPRSTGSRSRRRRPDRPRSRTRHPAHPFIPAPRSGFGPDLASFRFWANDLATNGLHGFYERDFFHDYTPGYLYVLWLVGTVGKAIGGIGDLIKIPPIIADVGIAYLAWSMLRELGVRDRLAVLTALVVMLNPIFWFDNVDLGPGRLVRRAVPAARPALALARPAGTRSDLRRHRRRDQTAARYPAAGDRGGHHPPCIATVAEGPGVDLGGRPDPATRGTDRPHRSGIVTTVLAGYITALILYLPFGLTVLQVIPNPPFVASGLLEQIALDRRWLPVPDRQRLQHLGTRPSDLGISRAAY